MTVVFENEDGIKEIGPSDEAAVVLPTKPEMVKEVPHVESKGTFTAMETLKILYWSQGYAEV